MEYIIYIDGCQFKGSEQAVDRVVAAIEAAGYVYNESTQGYESPEYNVVGV